MPSLAIFITALRWIIHLTTVEVSHVPNMACARGRNSSLDGSIWLLARLDAVEEVLHVRDRAVADAVFSEDRVLSIQYSLPIDTEAAPINLHSRLSATELKAAIID